MLHWGESASASFVCAALFSLMSIVFRIQKKSLMMRTNKSNASLSWRGLEKKLEHQNSTTQIAHQKKSRRRLLENVC